MYTVINNYELSIQQGCAPVSRAQKDAPCETGAPRLKKTKNKGGQLNSKDAQKYLILII